MYVKPRKAFVDMGEINKHLRFVRDNRLCIFRARENIEKVGHYAYIDNKEVYFNLTYRDDKGDTCTYVFRKDGQADTQTIDGAEAFRILSKYYKVPDYRSNEKVMEMSASPFLYKNKKYEGKRLNNVLGYDLNSAYGYAMTQPMPDTKDGYREGYVKDGEIGFLEMPITNDKNEITPSLTPVYTGSHSLYIFPLMESPFKKFIEVWNAKKLEGIKKAKEVINYSVGYLQRINPFLRATVIGHCNSLIKSLIDENTLYCNTDSLVSLKPRDLKIGTKIGEWKIEKQGEFAYIGYAYQWNTDAPRYRGVARSWFPEGYDILTDEIPHEGNIYSLDKKKLQFYCK